MLRAADPSLPVLEAGNSVVLSGTVLTGQVGWAPFLSGGAAVPESAALAAIEAVTPESLSDIMFTSGTTGHPKGVKLTHGQSLRAHGGYSRLLGFEAGDRYLIVPPFFHTFGYKAGWMACLVHGVTIIPEQVFDTDHVMSVIESERVTILYGPPTIFQSVLDSPRRAEHDLSSIRNVLISSTVVPQELLERTKRELRPELLHGGYGLDRGHLLRHGHSARCRQPRADRDRRSGVRTSTSRCGSSTTRDAMSRRASAGELLVRGFNVMSGYWEDPERTAEVIDADGWLHTGDVVTMDEQRYVRITDRKKDMILVGGFNVYPAEVERILGQHPDVEAIAVVAAPDPRLGEVAVAFVVARPGSGADRGGPAGLGRCPHRQLQVPPARVPGRRAAAQRQPQGAEERAAGSPAGPGLSRSGRLSPADRPPCARSPVQPPGRPARAAAPCR